jgi:DNA-binding transcriptional LysR family regulator
MVEGIEALLALERTGTISEAAAQLRLTQSAVSKRIQALENELKYRVIEPDGRRVRLTKKGQLFLNKARVLISELKNLKELEITEEVKKYSIALSDSVAASWGPHLVREASNRIKNAEFEIHVHRSTLVEENVKLGRYHLGLCISNSHDQQLVSETILEEPMVLVTNNSNREENKNLLTIEKSSGSWRALEDKILRHPKLKNFEITHSESFAAIIQMVKEGYGFGLVPLGLAQTMQVHKGNLLMLSPVLKRQIKLIARKGLAQQETVIEFKNHLLAAAKDLR